MKIFKLFACCIPVKGYSISIICDLQRKAHLYIPETLFEILVKHKNSTVDEVKAFYNHEFDERINEYYDYLISNEYGFYCSESERFPEIDLAFESPELINNAILDFNCNSAYNYARAFNELDLLGCKFIELRFFDSIKLDKLFEILAATFNKRFKSIDLYIKYSPEIPVEVIKNIFIQFGIIGKIIVHSAPFLKELVTDVMGCLYFIPQEIKDESCCGFISKSTFIYDIRFFSEGLTYNTCLNKKISLNTMGRIKNCPSLEHDFGHIDEASFIDAVAKQEFKSLWTMNKDQIKVCLDCQFRYICSDCRAFLTEPNSKPQKCNYDPYTNIWNY